MAITGGVGTGDPVPNLGKPLPTPRYSQSLIILYGIPIDGLPGIQNEYRIKFSFDVNTDPPQEFALIYGFSYQGNCYPLDPPRVFVVNSATKTAASGCGYDGDYYINTSAGPT